VIRGVDIKCDAAPGVLTANMAHAMTLGLPVLSSRLKEHDTKVAIVGTGPSVSDYLDELRSWRGSIWAINGALDWLQDRGIIAHGHVLADYGDRMHRYLTRPPKRTTYYVASVCHASVFEALKDRDVVMWHIAQHGEGMPPSGTYTVGGGPTALTRAPTLAWCLGFRDMHVFGGDSSFTPTDMYVEGAQDIHNRGGLPPDCITVRVGDREFLTHMPLVGQATYMATLVDSLPAKIKFYGDGFGPYFAHSHIERGIDGRHENAA
jgi:uncharacterized Rossmann fold enzyme